MNIKKNIPNALTIFRLIGTLLLPFTKVFSFGFFILYTLCGLSDLLDGWFARFLDATSEFGSKLDSVADLLFYAVMTIMTFPTMLKTLPVHVWVVVSLTFLARIFMYSYVAISQKRFAALHTYLNKATGLMVFCIPFYLRSAYVAACSTVGCIMAALATIEEMIIHLLCPTCEKTLLFYKTSRSN